VNTARGRKKTRNIHEGVKVTINVLDQTNPYRYIAIQGKVIEVTESGALKHFNKLSDRYFEKSEYPQGYPLQGGEIRVLVRIKPSYVHVNGG